MIVLQVYCALLQMETNHPLFHYVFAVLGCFTTLFGTLLPEVHTLSIRSVPRSKHSPSELYKPVS